MEGVSEFVSSVSSFNVSMTAVNPVSFKTVHLNAQQLSNSVSCKVLRDVRLIFLCQYVFG